MACYLGNIAHVAQLVNESRIHPDVSDVQGNTAIMYATVSLLHIALSVHNDFTFIFYMPY